MTQTSRRPYPLLPLGQSAKLEQDIAAAVQAGPPVPLMIGGGHADEAAAARQDYRPPQAGVQVATAAPPLQLRPSARVVREPGGKLVLHREAAPC